MAQMPQVARLHVPFHIPVPAPAPGVAARGGPRTARLAASQPCARSCIVARVSHERQTPGLPFIVTAADDRLGCRDLRGFEEALLAALDPRAPSPPRIWILDPATTASPSLFDRWAEDAEQVRRTLVLRRARDGAEVRVVATLASHGFGVPTSIVVESVRAGDRGEIVRSGVHLKVDVERAPADQDEPAWGAPDLA